MAGGGSAIARAYQYNPQAYSGVLNKIHNQVQSNLESVRAAGEAYELQSILQEIKQTARLLGTQPLTTAEIELLNQYQDLIEQTMQVQSFARASYKATSGKKMNENLKSALFHRGNATKTIAGVDNIFEEELAALIAAIEKRLTGHGEIYSYLAGSESADVAAMNDLTDDIEKKVIEETQEVANKMQKKYDAKKIMKGKSQKIDNKGLTIDLLLGVDINEGKIYRLAQLLKDASFTDKQYNRWGKDGARDYMNVQLHLGNTNLYKAITGVVSEVYPFTNIQRSIFFRGLQILKGTKRPPSATPQEVTRHFVHMRFNYELRGTGLLDRNGNSSVAKYIIYNDPSSDVIYVRDTASIILEEMKKSRSNLFGDITIAASRVKSS